MTSEGRRGWFEFSEQGKGRSGRKGHSKVHRKICRYRNSYKFLQYKALYCSDTSASNSAILQLSY
eukprot:2976854-Rhodomonas_salina.5